MRLLFIVLSTADLPQKLVMEFHRGLCSNQRSDQQLSVETAPSPASGARRHLPFQGQFVIIHVPFLSFFFPFFFPFLLLVLSSIFKLLCCWYLLNQCLDFTCSAHHHTFTLVTLTPVNTTWHFLTSLKWKLDQIQLPLFPEQLWHVSNKRARTGRYSLFILTTVQNAPVSFSPFHVYVVISVCLTVWSTDTRTFMDEKLSGRQWEIPNKTMEIPTPFLLNAVPLSHRQKRAAVFIFTTAMKALFLFFCGEQH